MTVPRNASLVKLALVVFILQLALKRSVHGDALNQDNINKEKHLPAATRSNRTAGSHAGSPTIITINLSKVSIAAFPDLMHDVRKRSVSPWNISVVTDPNRIPQSFPEVTCLYKGCVDAKGQENPSLSSAPIVRQILFLRRDQRANKSIYQLELKPMTVGCTCVIPRYA